VAGGSLDEQRASPAYSVQFGRQRTPSSPRHGTDDPAWRPAAAGR